MKLGAIFVFLLSVEVYAGDWVGPFEYSKIPSNAMVAGSEITGKPIYLGLAYSGDTPINQIYPGKPVVQDLNVALSLKESGNWAVAKVNPQYRGARFAVQIEEKYSPYYLLYIPAKGEKHEWSAKADGETDARALHWIEGGKLRYVCRAKWQGGVFVGTLLEGAQSCIFGFGKRAKSVYFYELLLVE